MIRTYLFLLLSINFNCSEGLPPDPPFEKQLKEALIIFYQGDFHPLVDLVKADIEELPLYFTKNREQRLLLTKDFKVEYVKKELNTRDELVFWFLVNERKIAVPVSNQIPHILEMNLNCLFIDLLQEESKLRYDISQTIENSINPQVSFWNGNCNYIAPENEYDFKKETSLVEIDRNIQKYESLVINGDSTAILGITAFLNSKLNHDSSSNEEYRATLKKLVYWYKECGKYNIFCLEELLSLLNKGIISTKMLGSDKVNLLHKIYDLNPCDPGYLELIYIYTTGEGVNKDLKLAEQLKATALDCTQTHPRMAWAIGARYKYGMYGFPIDRCKTIEYYEKAIELGYENHMVEYYKLKEEVDCVNDKK